MLSRDYEIYYYSDSHMEPVDLHEHNYYEFYFFLEGDVSIQIEEKLYGLRLGDVVVIPPGVRHRAVIHNPNLPYSRFVFWISIDYYERLNMMSEDFFYTIRCVRE